MHRLIQLTLDLFERLPSGRPDAAEAEPRVPPLQPDTRRRAKRPGPPANTRSRPTAPTLEAPLAPVLFRHVRANRELQLGPAVVAFHFERGRRRTIGFSVGPEGLQVRAPAWTPLSQVDAVLQDKADWIVRKLEQHRVQQQHRLASCPKWTSGETVSWRGQGLQLQLQPTVDPRPQAKAPLAVHRVGADLQVHMPPGAQASQIRDAVHAWLQREALQCFAERLAHYAPLLGVRWQRLALSHAATRWGSANSKGVIRLHWRLIHFDLGLIDYVVVHELSHLRVMNHSPQFWATVASVMPDYARQRASLRQQAIQVPDAWDA